MQVNGARVRELRRAGGESIEQLSVRIGIGSQTLANIERGGTGDPRRLTLQAIAAGLGVTVEDITDQDGEPSAVPA